MSLRRRLPGLAFGAVVLVAACGPGTGPSAQPSASTTGFSVLPIVISSELVPGSNRLLFAFLDANTNAPAAAPDRKVSLAFTGPGGATASGTPPAFIWAIEGERGVYASTVDFPVAGDWQADFTTSAPNSPEVTIPFRFNVLPKASALRPGDQVPSVDAPTAADVGGDLSRISTDADPVPAFYTTSIADALAAKKPFVVVFATPKFCTSQQCGPTLDRIKPIAAAHPEVTFINVEPYELEYRDGGLQPVLDAGGQVQAVPAVKAFGLLTEPVVVVVGADGKVKATFETIFGDDELSAAIAAVE
jgi:hypothetical protein